MKKLIAHSNLASYFRPAFTGPTLFLALFVQFSRNSLSLDGLYILTRGKSLVKRQSYCFSNNLKPAKTLNSQRVTGADNRFRQK